MHKAAFSKTILVVLIILLATPFNTAIKTSGLEGRTLYVGGSGEGNYSTIQDAVFDANDGDTIFVYNGTYRESVYIGKRITLIGESKEGVLIEAGLYGFGINVSCDGVIIKNFSIIHARWNEAAIDLFNCHGCNIQNCRIYENEWYGIRIENAENNEIKDCEIFGNVVGIEIDGSKENKVRGCNIYGNGVAIQVENGNGNEIRNCRISSNSWNGIFIAGSGGNKIYDCEFNENGITITGDSLQDFIQDIYNSSIDGKPIINIKNEKFNLEGVEAGEIIAVGCSDFSIKNCTAANKDVSVEIVYCRNGIIKNCSIYNGNYGLLLYNSSHNIIEGNAIENANESGIELEKSNNNLIRNNNIIYCSNNGISLTQSCYNGIYENEVHNNGMGILIFSYSDDNNVSHNHVYSNHFYGISIQGGCYNVVEENKIEGNSGWCGVALVKSWTKYNVIRKNNISSNACGVHLEGIGNSIERNNIYRNGRGIYLSAWLSKCKRNVITGNNFIKNSIQAGFEVDILSLNKWNGNYWDDWHHTMPRPIFGNAIIKFGRRGFGIRLPWVNFDFHPSTEPLN